MSSVAAEAPLDVGRLWQAARLPVVIAVAGLALVGLLAAVTASSTVPLDPRSTAPTGTHALAVLLRAQGVSVGVPGTLRGLVAGATAGNETVVLAEPGGLSDSVLRRLAASTATVVLIGPQARELAAFSVAAHVDNLASDAVLSPGCPLPAAVTAGSVRVDGILYAAGRGTMACYRAGPDAALLTTIRSGSGRTVVLGDGGLLSNAHLAAQGNAALGLGLLDGSPRLAWVPPGALGGALAASDRRGLVSLLPDGLVWGLLQLLVALIVFALWRARRLGRPVVEPLPVVVRAAETVEGNARLLHAAKARDTAAAALRAATIRRLAASLRLGRDPSPAALVAVVAEHSGQAADGVHEMLYGAEPVDDAGLVRLATALPELETSVGRNAPSHPTRATTIPADPSTGGQQ
jgi:hypothetical protein